MSISNKLKERGFKSLDVSEAPVVVASTDESEIDKALTLIRSQKELLIKQQAQLQQQQRTISSLMGMIDVLKKKKASSAEAKPAQKEESSTMAQLKKRFGL